MGDPDIYKNIVVADRQIQFIQKDQPLVYGDTVWCNASSTSNNYFMQLFVLSTI